MFKEKKSFFERITGSISVSDEEENEIEEKNSPIINSPKNNDWEEEEEDGELAIDVYQKENEIIIQAMIAGVKPENLNINITREMVTIQGHRDRQSEVEAQDYFQKELYWGSFSRKILLPGEVEPTESEAIEKNGLLTIKMPKINKDKTQKIKVKSI